MLLNRRSFTALTAASVTVAVLSDQARAAARSSFKAIAFDGFPIIDSRPVFARVEEMFPGKGAELSASWRIRQFEYGWLRTLGGRYTDFWRVTEDALIFAARAMKIELSSEQRERLMQTYLELKAWPDAEPALRQLCDAGVRMAFLSNLTAPMLDAVIRNSGLEGCSRLTSRPTGSRPSSPTPAPTGWVSTRSGCAKRRSSLRRSRAGMWLERSGSATQPSGSIAAMRSSRSLALCPTERDPD
ncbi:haloacid dehalogenase type II [Bradyrhizobium elkanii]|uniref:haloacid dehalogenase type II n=1 Tax=Bradyrhizobium elkanii TaxID=29448 RepID=UPI002227AE13|nr:haloacid dehalogenase type II [Bradyrhizobium elkanii]